MWRCEDVDLQMWGCEDVDLQLWGCEDLDQQMWRCEDLDQQVWRCEDADQQMWGCEDVDQQMWGCEDVDRQVWGVKMYYNGCFFRKNPSQALSGKTPHVRNTFGSCDVEKARSTFPSQNSQNTPCSDHFWKLRCRKSARRCGAKHISKLKVEKTSGFGALLDVQMSFRVAGWRDCAPRQKWGKTWGFCSSFSYNHHITLHYTNYITLH